MTVSLEEARMRLDELIARLAPGEEVVIAHGGQPIAVLSKVPRASWPCRAGSAAHRPHWMAPDFDAPLEDFREYMGRGPSASSPRPLRSPLGVPGHA